MRLNLKALKETKDFYKVELERGDLTEKERNKFLRALRFIEGFIKREEEAGGKGKDKNPFLNPDGGLDLIERFPGIDYMPYEKKIKKSNKIRWRL